MKPATSLAAIILFLSVSILTSPVFAQISIAWQNTFGDANPLVNETPLISILDKEGNLYIIGTRSDSADSMLTVKFDSDGNIVWHLTKELDGSYTTIRAVFDDQSNLIVTYTNSNTGSEWLLKYDTNGNEKWNFEIGTNVQDYYYPVSLLSSGGNIYLVTEVYPDGSYKPNGVVFAFDINGNELWSNTFITAPSYGYFELKSTVLVGGRIYIGGIWYNEDYYTQNGLLYCINTAGEILWTRSPEQRILTLTGGSDGNIYYVSYFRNATLECYDCVDFYEFGKIDSSGNEIWHIGQVNNGLYTNGLFFRAVSVNNNDEFILAGLRSTYGRLFGLQITSDGEQKHLATYKKYTLGNPFHPVTLDAEDRIVAAGNGVPYYYRDARFYVIDSGVLSVANFHLTNAYYSLTSIIAGENKTAYASGIEYQYINGQQCNDFMAIKICYDDNCPLRSSQQETGGEISIFPNPFSQSFEISLPSSDLATMSIYDVRGSLLYSSSFESRFSGGNELLPGIYMIRLVMQDGTVVMKKLVKSE